MIYGVDSATPPSLAQIDSAKALGVSMWNGYLATRDGVNLLRPWLQREFDVARTTGCKPIAYCSGWDDPLACKSHAIAWDVWLCLDVESSIRGDGDWVQAWLDASGAGLYGNYQLHQKYSAAFHIMAGGPYWTSGNGPQLSWPQDQPRPNAPCGWQQQGTHTIAGGSAVDAGWYDDFFSGGEEPMTDAERLEIGRGLTSLYYQSVLHRTAESVAAADAWATQIAAAIKAGNGTYAVLEAMRETPEATADETADAELVKEQSAIASIVKAQ